MLLWQPSFPRWLLHFRLWGVRLRITGALESHERLGDRGLSLDLPNLRELGLELPSPCALRLLYAPRTLILGQYTLRLHVQGLRPPCLYILGLRAPDFHYVGPRALRLHVLRLGILLRAPRCRLMILSALRLYILR